MRLTVGTFVRCQQMTDKIEENKHEYGMVFKCKNMVYASMDCSQFRADDFQSALEQFFFSTSSYKTSCTDIGAVTFRHN